MTLRLLRWLKANTFFDPVVLLVRDGPLRTSFEELASVVCLHPAHRAHRLAAFPGLRRFSALVEKRRAKRQLECLGPFEIVYSSTLTNGHVLRDFVPGSAPVLSRASELQHWLSTRVRADDLRYTLERSDHIIAVSQAVRSNLLSEHGYPEARMSVIPGFVDSVPDLSALARGRGDARAVLAIDDSAFVVGGVGTLDWRKAPELFVQIARASRRHSDVRFVWVGGGAPGRVEELEYDVRASGLDNISFVGERHDAAELMGAFDVLCLTSREDPYPVVMLEAGAHAVPVVAFAGSGGAPEFARRGGGLVVDYLDVEGMASTIRDLVADRQRLADLGSRARELVLESHTVDVAAPQIGELLVKVTAEEHRGARSG